VQEADIKAAVSLPDVGEEDELGLGSRVLQQ